MKRCFSNEVSLNRQHNESREEINFSLLHAEQDNERKFMFFILPPEIESQVCEKGECELQTGIQEEIQKIYISETLHFVLG